MYGLSKAYEYRGERYSSGRNQNLDRAIDDYRQALTYWNDYQDKSNEAPRLPSRLPLRRSNTVKQKLAEAYLRRGRSHRRRSLSLSQAEVFDDFSNAFEALALDRASIYAYCPGGSGGAQRRLTLRRSPSSPLPQRRLTLRPSPLPGRNGQRVNLSRLRPTRLENEIRRSLASAYMRRGDTANNLFSNQTDAIEAYCEAIRVDRSYAAAYLKLGQVLLSQEKPDEAIATYQKVVELDPNNFDAYLALGNAWASLGNEEEASRAFVRAINIDPANFAAIDRLAEIDIQSAINLIRNYIVHNPNNASLHYSLGWLLYTDRDFQGASDSNRRAISLNPRDVKAHYALGWSLMAQGNFQDAIASYNRALRFDPGYAKAYYGLAQVFARQSNWAQAIANYERAIQIEPRYAKAYNGLGQALAAQQQWRRAIRSYREALNLDPEYTSAYHNLGLVYQSVRYFDQAIYHYRKALGISPDYAEAQNNLAQAESQLEDWLEAQDYRGPTGASDWFWLPQNDENLQFKRAVVRIVSENSSEVGAGWVIKREDDRLWVVTNRHVVDSGGAIQAQFFSEKPPGRQHLQLPARLLQSTDLNDEIDLALLVIDNAPRDIRPLDISANNPSTVSRVRIIGHPSIGEDWTISEGPVSNARANVLQLNATVAPGNSGGPVINDQNQVVGIIHSSAGSAEDLSATGGFAYAYPISYLQNTLTYWGIEVPSR
ncbi:MAG: tetratricopeptide repeat protein [Cyanobacteria bacterium P01_G01_bin.38]